jgi:hypothetical protein
MNGRSALKSPSLPAYSGFQSHRVRPLFPMPDAPRPDPTRMYSSQPGTALGEARQNQPFSSALNHTCFAKLEAYP